jgi:nucleoside-diphosphate kinase
LDPGPLRAPNSFNLIHGSDSPEAAVRELGLFFKDGEVLDFARAGDAWVYDMSGGKPE